MKYLSIFGVEFFDYPPDKFSKSWWVAPALKTTWISLFLIFALAPAGVFAGRFGDKFQLFDGYLVNLENYAHRERSDGPVVKDYTILKIAQREDLYSTGSWLGDFRQQMTQMQAGPEGEFDLARYHFVPSAISYAQEFVEREYAKRGRITALNAIKNERKLLNGVSMLIMIMEKNDISRIHAVGRIVYRGQRPENWLLDVESRTGIRMPPLPLKPLYGGLGQSGEWAELKTLLVAKDSPINFSPILWAELTGHDQHQFLFSTTQLTDPRRQIAVDHYVIETDRPRLYTPMGFKEFVKIPTQNAAQGEEDVSVMTLDSETMVSAIREMKIHGAKGIPQMFFRDIRNIPSWQPEMLFPFELRKRMLDANIKGPVSILIPLPPPMNDPIQFDCTEYLKSIVDHVPFFSVIRTPKLLRKK